MERILIHKNIGEFGFNQFHVREDDKWVWFDLEVDIEALTLSLFKDDNNVQFQIWVTEDRAKLGIASNFRGHIRQALLPMELVEQVKIKFVRPAKGGGEFELLIDSRKYKGQIMSGEIKVDKTGSYWDMSDYEKKKNSLKKTVESILSLTKGELTSTVEFTNA